MNKSTDGRHFVVLHYSRTVSCNAKILMNFICFHRFLPSQKSSYTTAWLLLDTGEGMFFYQLTLMKFYSPIAIYVIGG